jgi:hypothetical protein
MEAHGWDSREMARRVASQPEGSISHGTIENWKKDTVLAKLDAVERVAQVFGWTGRELLYGEAPRDIMLRYAQLQAWRVRAERYARAIAGASPVSSAMASDDRPLREQLVGGQESGEEPTDADQTGISRRVASDQ